MLPAASPGIALACLHTWQELRESGKLAGPQRSGSEAKGSVWATGETWRENMEGAQMRVLGPPGWEGLGKSLHVPSGPQSSQLKNERAGNTDSSSNLPQISSSLGF